MRIPCWSSRNAVVKVTGSGRSWFRDSQITLRERACGAFEIPGQTEFLQVDLPSTMVMEGDQGEGGAVGGSSGEGGAGGSSSGSGSSGSLVPMIAAASSDTAGMLAGQVEPAPHALQSAY